jgi:nitrate reductase gamma subunit
MYEPMFIIGKTSINLRDDTTGIIIIIVAVVILIGWIQWIIGRAIGRRVSRTTGLVLGIVLILLGFSLLIGIPCIIYSQNNADAAININNVNQRSSNQRSSWNDTMECPYCAETIKKNAKICRYCNNKL